MSDRVMHPTDEEIVEGYFANFAGDKSAFWAFEEACNLLTSDPERLWRITLQLISRAPDELTLSYVAAGPLEDLLARQGLRFIARVELLANTDSKFLKALTGVWGHTRFEPEIHSRVKTVIATNL